MLDYSISSTKSFKVQAEREIGKLCSGKRNTTFILNYERFDNTIDYVRLRFVKSKADFNIVLQFLEKAKAMTICTPTFLSFSIDILAHWYYLLTVYLKVSLSCNCYLVIVLCLYYFHTLKLNVFYWSLPCYFFTGQQWRVNRLALLFWTLHLLQTSIFQASVRCRLFRYSVFLTWTFLR